MLGLKMDQEVLGELVRMKVPAVWQAMNRHNVMWTLVVSRWFICLYIDILPVEVRMKVKGCSLLKEIHGKLCSHWTNFSPYEMISQFFVVFDANIERNDRWLGASFRQCWEYGTAFSTRDPRSCSVWLWRWLVTIRTSSHRHRVSQKSVNALNRSLKGST